MAEEMQPWPRISYGQITTKTDTDNDDDDGDDDDILQKLEIPDTGGYGLLIQLSIPRVSH